MRPESRCCKASAWIILIAMWFACLAPNAALAFTNRNAGDGYWVQLCSMSGSHSVWVDTTPSDITPDGAQPDDGTSGHCLFCSHHTVLGPSCADVGPTRASGPALLLPRSYFHSPRPLFSWAGHKTRGPPHAGHLVA